MDKRADPLDAHIVVSEQERKNRALLAENVHLGVMLLHAKGYVVLKGAVPDSLVSELRSSFKPIYEDNVRRLQSGLHYTEFIGEGEDSASVFWERKSRFRISPKLKGPFASPYVLRNPFAEPIIAETLGSNYYCKFVSSDTCVKGAIKQAPHRDTDFYDEDNVRGSWVNIPIMHCGLHNGPTEVWPGGSHLWRSDKFFKFGLHPFIQDDVNPTVETFASHIPSKLIELQPGDLLIRDPGMWHRGTPNPTDEPRTMLTIGYFRSDYYFQYGDPLHNLDEKLYKALDPSTQQLFAPFFDKTDSRYWKLRQTRSIRSIADQRYLGYPLRIALRVADRVKARIRTYWAT